MNIKSFTLNSFAKSIEGGNPAGVILNADFLSEDEMKKAAAIIGFSETAFVLKSNCADFKVRFFTPNHEVDLCGHATVAAFFTLQNQGIIGIGEHTQETKAGILKVEVKQDCTVMMNQNKPGFYDILDKKEIADSLNIASNEMIEELPVQIVSTGIKDIIVPIKNIKILNSIAPDFKKVEDISKKYDVTGYHLFTLETLNNSTANCRNFAPLYAIPEESATGTSNGALSCYLYKYNRIKHNETKNIVIEQGYSMKKPSEIIVSLSTDGENITEVKVGGKALNLAEKEFEI